MHDGGRDYAISFPPVQIHLHSKTCLLSLRSILTCYNGFQTPPKLSPERRWYVGGHGTGTNAKEPKIKFASFHFSLLIIWLPLKYLKNCCTSDYRSIYSLLLLQTETVPPHTAARTWTMFRNFREQFEKKRKKRRKEVLFSQQYLI